MKKIIVVAASTLLPLVAGTAWANETHHPADAAPAASQRILLAAKAPDAPKPPAAQGPSFRLMDEHMKRMQDMHERMLAAKTPEERQKLMDEQAKLMQEGMGMMKDMGGMMGPRGGMGMMGDQTGNTMMMKRMDMMQMMMQMMMDRENVRMPPRP
ncbi:hypothetical protein [Pseudogulbenkiania ferrooxidans]|uniref:Uncharacterized protein n=1 Tax=Pseudogulbenkiania ferrooxidans 2002 TaxID=279714 RepID=B9YYX9_9NEIS|nr:hypothetical protein [Pseudogulbenkiania ferrooxidans]EEG10332.1 conserved hypothetical protein [Pseudogulbenkiania ferrooxidans 2002]